MVVGFAARPGQYFKRPDIRKELTRYARVLSFRKTTLSSAGQAGVAAHPLAEPKGWGRGREGAEEAPPAAILLFVQPPSAVTLAPVARRHPLSRPIGAFNRQQPANVEKRINP